MINNRQAGRRRGRGGQRPPNNGQGRTDQGNRIDNRARGNASQLLEKYKTLARDAQMQGDRVNTEYYLQFADHYFRVLNESRARLEDNRRQRDDNQGEDDDEGYEARGGDDDGGDRGFDRGENNRQYQQQPRREARNDDRPADDDREDDRGNRYVPAPAPAVTADPYPVRDEAPRARNGGDEAAAGQQQTPQPARRGRPRKVRPEEAEQPGGSIEIDRLPPALSREEIPSANGDDEQQAPRRRTRRPRTAADDGAVTTQD